MHRPFHCPHCRRDSQLVTPGPWTRLLLAFAWVHAALLVLCAAMLGPFMMLVLPFVLAFGTGLVTGAQALAGEPATCARCERIVARRVAERPGAQAVGVARAA